MPGFLPRLRRELLRALSFSKAPAPTTLTIRAPTKASGRHLNVISKLASLRATPKFAPLSPLGSHIVITNDPSRHSDSASPRLHISSGQAPAFACSLLPWVGGSLAGLMKTGGEEISRERWEQATEKIEKMANEEGLVANADVVGEMRSGFINVLPDWTTTSFRIGLTSS